MDLIGSETFGSRSPLTASVRARQEAAVPSARRRRHGPCSVPPIGRPAAGSPSRVTAAVVVGRNEQGHRHHLPVGRRVPPLALDGATHV